MKLQHSLQVSAALAVTSLAPAAQAHLSGTHDAAVGAGMLHLLFEHGYLLVILALGLGVALFGGRTLWRLRTHLRRAKR